MTTPLTYTNDSLNPWLLAMDIILLIHAAWSYYRYCLRGGYKLDFWHFTLIMGGVLPILVNYIFAGAWENYHWVWGGMGLIQANLDWAFGIAITGYIANYVGFYYFNWTIRTANRPVGIVAERIIGTFASLFSEFVRVEAAIYVHLAITVAGAVWLLSNVFNGGVGLNLRAEVFGDSALRPVYNFVFQAEGPILLTALLARYLDIKTTKYLLLALVMVLVESLSGARGPIILPLGTVAAVYAVSRRRKLNISTIAAGAAILLALALSIQIARSLASTKDTLDTRSVNPIEELLYGNEYSDTRDLAWTISGWDGDYALGRTYAAGLLAFLPRYLFATEFRETWGYTYYSDRMVGLDPEKHSGLRPTHYGESFLNFGYLGVIFVGFVGGYFCRMIDYWIKVRVESGQPGIVNNFALTTAHLGVGLMYNSQGVWQLYVLIFMLITARMISLLAKKRGGSMHFASIRQTTRAVRS